MSELKFQEQREQAWGDFEAMLKVAERKRKWEQEAVGLTMFPEKFREICSDLALARHRMYREELLDRLNGLVIRGYRVLYRRRSRWGEKLLHFVSATFPAKVREDARLFWLCSALFCLPFILMFLAANGHIEWIEAVLDPSQMRFLDIAYGKEGGGSLAEMRGEFGSNFEMFGFYINNNISIDFQVFAGGIVAGLGTLFYLIYNGLLLGASAGYVHYTGSPEAFWSFVVGHSSFELIGMLIAGMAGLKLGLAILRPGRLSRARAIGVAARDALPLILGAAGMTAIAAVIEGFWSAQDFPVILKYTFGGVMWALHGLYFGLLGRKETP